MKKANTSGKDETVENQKVGVEDYLAPNFLRG